MIGFFIVFFYIGEDYPNTSLNISISFVILLSSYITLTSAQSKLKWFPYSLKSQQSISSSQSFRKSRVFSLV